MSVLDLLATDSDPLFCR